jgi:hypothetical protein
MTAAILPPENAPTLQEIAMTEMHVPMTAVTQRSDVSILQNLAMTTTDALLTHANQMSDALTPQLFVTITTLVPKMFAPTDAVHTTQSKLKSTLTNVRSTCVTRRTENTPEMLTVMTTTHVLLTAVTNKLDNALTSERPVMTTTHVPETAAISKADNAPTLQSPAMTTTHVSPILVTEILDCA